MSNSACNSAWYFLDASNFFWAKSCAVGEIVRRFKSSTAFCASSTILFWRSTSSWIFANSLFAPRAFAIASAAAFVFSAAVRWAWINAFSSASAKLNSFLAPLGEVTVNLVLIVSDCASSDSSSISSVNATFALGDFNKSTEFPCVSA